MKIKKLHIYNIASIIDETIDFTQHPLTDSDVFLITGNMGSGKSTILDAICLALYNTTPRLAGLKKEKVKNSNFDDITLDDPRRLMRHQTGEATVTLLFEGIDGVDYEAEWHVQRGKNKKASAQLNNIDWSIKNLSNGNSITASKSPNYKDVEDEIVKAVGLDYTQFCRTTMLAQGEFTAFLKSDEDKKGEILSKLTHFDECTKAGIQIHKTTQEKKKAWEDAKEKANDTGLSEAELEEMNSKVDTLGKQASVQKAESENAQAKKDWIDAEIRLLSAKTTAEENKKKAQEQIESESYKSDNLIVKQWNETSNARQWFANKQEAEQNVAKYNAQIKDLEATFGEVLDGHAHNKATNEATAKEIAAAKQTLAANADKAPVFEKESLIVDHLKTIADAKEAIEAKHKAIAENRKKYNDELVPAEQKAKADYEEATKALSDLDAQIAGKDNEMKALNLSALYNRRTELNNRLNALESAKTAVENVSKQKSDRQRKQDDLSQMEKQIFADEKKLEDEAEHGMKMAKKVKDECEKELQAMRDTVDTFAVSLRSRLTEGCTCPVCRQTVEKLPVESELNGLFTAVEEKSKKAKELFEEKQKEYNALAAKINADKQSYNRQKDAFDKDTSVKDAEQKVQEACGKVGITNITENILTDIENLRKETQDTLDNELKTKIENAELLNNELGDLRKNRTVKNTEVDRLRNAHHEAKEAVQKADNAKGGLENTITEKQNDISRRENAVTAILGNTQWEHDWKQDAQGFTDELHTLAKKHRELTKMVQTLENEHQLAEQNTKTVESVIEAIRGTMADWKDVESTNSHEVQDVERKANDLKANLTTALSMLEIESTKATDNDKALQAYLSSHQDMSVERLVELGKYPSEEIIERQKKNEGVRNEASNAEVLLKEANKEYEAHIVNKPAMTDEDSRENLEKIILESNGKVEKLNQQIGALNAVLKLDKDKKEKLGDLREKADKAREEYEKWNRLNRYFGSADGKVFRNIAQSYILDGLLKTANTYLQKLEPRYTLKAVPGTLHISLEDAYQGFATRSTFSSSGGEGFLVSLALALALANIGQALAVDTLFIDEGFGTLSGQPLVNAINTLRSLHDQSGRHVGIISHIQEVRDNIPVQIQVKQSSGSSSSTIEVCEVQ